MYLYIPPMYLYVTLYIYICRYILNFCSLKPYTSKGETVTLNAITHNE